MGHVSLSHRPPLYLSFNVARQDANAVGQLRCLTDRMRAVRRASEERLDRGVELMSALGGMLAGLPASFIRESLMDPIAGNARTKRENRLRWSWRLSAVAAVAIYSWLATGVRPFTVPADVVVGIPVVVLLALSWYRTGLGRPLLELQLRHAPRELAAWAAVIGLLAAWELAAYASSPRHAHPTVSSISDAITSGHAARAVIFGLWIIVGWYVFLVRGPRARTSAP